MPVLMYDGILKRKESRPDTNKYRSRYPPARIKLETHMMYTKSELNFSVIFKLNVIHVRSLTNNSNNTTAIYPDIKSRIEHTPQQRISIDPTHQTKIWTTSTYCSKVAVCLNITNFISHSALLTLCSVFLHQNPPKQSRSGKEWHIQSNVFYMPVFICGINWSSLKQLYLERIRYTKCNNTQRVYALHIAQVIRPNTGHCTIL
jgi:hypothetical protein